MNIYLQNTKLIFQNSSNFVPSEPDDPTPDNPTDNPTPSYVFKQVFSGTGLDTNASNIGDAVGGHFSEIIPAGSVVKVTNYNNVPSWFFWEGSGYSTTSPGQFSGTKYFVPSDENNIAGIGANSSTAKFDVAYASIDDIANGKSPIVNSEISTDESARTSLGGSINAGETLIMQNQGSKCNLWVYFTDGTYQGFYSVYNIAFTLPKTAESVLVDRSGIRWKIWKL